MERANYFRQQMEEKDEQLKAGQVSSLTPHLDHLDHLNHRLLDWLDECIMRISCAVLFMSVWQAQIAQERIQLEEFKQRIQEGKEQVLVRPHPLNDQAPRCTEDRWGLNSTHTMANACCVVSGWLLVAANERGLDVQLKLQLDKKFEAERKRSDSIERSLSCAICSTPTPYLLIIAIPELLSNQNKLTKRLHYNLKQKQQPGMQRSRRPWPMPGSRQQHVI